MEIFYMIIGLVAIYSTIHFFLLQNKGFKERTSYEKVVSAVAMSSIVLIFLSAMS